MNDDVRSTVPDAERCFDRASAFAREVEQYVRTIDPQGCALGPLLNQLDWFRNALGRLRTSYLRPSPLLVVPYSDREYRYICEAGRPARGRGTGRGHGAAGAGEGVSGIGSTLVVASVAGRSLVVVSPLADVADEDEEEYYLGNLQAAGTVLVVPYGKHRASDVVTFLCQARLPLAVALLVPPDIPLDRAASEVRESWKRRGVKGFDFKISIYPVRERILGEESEDSTLGSVLESIADELVARERDPREDVQRLVEQFRERCRPIYDEFEKQLRHELDELHSVEAALPLQLVQYMVPDDTHLETDVRHRLRLKTFSMTPLWCFPYRSLVGLLVLSAGAWDRLLLLPVSKIGSWFRLSRSVGKNIRDIRSMFRRLGQTAVERCKWEAARRLLPTLRHLDIKIWKLTTREDEERVYRDKLTPEAVTVSGLDAIAERVRATLEEAVGRVSPPSAGVFLAALLATGLFVFFMSAPVYAAYDAYFAAWQRSILQGDDLAWTDFRPFSATVLLAAFLYSAAPGFVIAMLALSFATRRGAVKTAAQIVRAACKETLDEAARKGLVRVDVNAPKVQALIRLRRLLWGTYLPE